MNENIDKTKLIKKVVKKLSKNHYKTHVINVINILLDELIFDFLRGKALKLFNFCEIKNVLIGSYSFEDFKPLHDKNINTNGNINCFKYFI